MIDRLDHIVLTVENIEATCNFYSRVLGMKVVTSSRGRKSLCFGSQKINLHQRGQAIEPRAHQPTPGSADLCFIFCVPLATMMEHLQASGIHILEGPVRRTGAVGPIVSLYFRDPDLNLIEVGTYDEVSN